MRNLLEMRKKVENEGKTQLGLLGVTQVIQILYIFL